MKDFQMLTLCFTFFIALYKINPLALWEGQTSPGLDSRSVMGVSVPYTTAAGHLPHTDQTTAPQ